MLNTEDLWNKALIDNNVRGITHWLRSLNTKGQVDVDKSLAKFNCWLQCSSELTTKELLSLCSGQCHGQWMFLDQTSFTKLCLLIQKLKNLLLVAHWGHQCVMCQMNANALAKCRCWTALRQHILLGKLVQWCSISGLLPQYPDANKLKQISQMWQEMTSCLELRSDTQDKYRGSSIVQCIVAHMHKQYGPLWVSEDCNNQTYPPPSLHSLLKLILVPYKDTTSAVAIIMYFFLDVSNMQSKGDLLESFCHTFSILSSFFKQIYGLWLLDHGFVSNSLGKLLSPGTSSAWLSCHSYDVLRTLLRQGWKQAAIKYLNYTKPAIKNSQDARLYVDVLLQNNCVAEAQILLRKCQLGTEYLLKDFTCDWKNHNLCGALASNIPHLKLLEKTNSTKPDEINQRNLGVKLAGNIFVGKGHTPCPFSALLYQCLLNGSLTPEDFVRLLKETVTKLNPPKPTRMMVVWPKYMDKSEDNRTTSLSPETFCHLRFCPHPVALQKDQIKLLQNDRMKVCVASAVVSSGSTSSDRLESASSFISFPSPVPADRIQEDARVEDCDLLSDNTQCSSHFALTVGAALKTMLISKDSVDELVTYDNGVEDDSTCALQGNLVDPAESHFSNKDNQSLLYSAAMSPVDDDNFLIPYLEKMIEDEVQEHSVNISADEREQFSILSSDSLYCQDSICNKPSESCSFLDLKPLRRALPYLPVEKSFRSSCDDPQDAMDQPEILTSCAHPETMQISDQTCTLKAGEPDQSSLLASVGSSFLVMNINPVQNGSSSQASLGASLLPLSSGGKGRNAESKEVVCFRTTTDRVGDCKLGSWWKQALETRRASTGLLPAIEQIPAVTKEKRHSLVLGWPQSHGLIRGLKQEVKQATKEEPSSRKAKGKRCKQVKQS